MSALLWRIILAVIGVTLIWALLPPVMRVLGLDLSADLVLILRLCIAGIAVFYVLANNPFKTP